MASFTPIGVVALVKGYDKFRSDLRKMGDSIQQTGKYGDGVKGQFLGLGSSVLNLGKTAAMAAAGGIAALGAGLTAIVATSVGVAARVSEMNRVIHFLGEEAGLTTGEVDEFVQQLVDAGIRLDVAQQVAAQFIRRNIDMAQAIDLVKVAQGAAVIANEDSSDTLRALMDAIVTNNVLMLRRRGITVDATVAYEEYVKAQKGGTQATIDNSEAIAEQTQNLDFLRREVQMAEDNFHAQNAELIHARDHWAEGSNELQKFQTRVDKASLALDKKRAKLAEAEKGLVALKAAHGTLSDAVKVTTDDLTGEERSAAFLNAVLKDGEKLIPLYGEAMKEPGKRARSLKRDIFNLRLAIGTPFLKAFGAGVDALRAFVKQLTEAIAEGGALRPVIEAIAAAATGVITKILDLASQVATLALAGDFGGILGMLGLGPEATALMGKVLADLKELAQVILGVLGPAVRFVADNAMPALTQAIAFVNEHWDAFRGALVAVGALLAGAALAAAIVGLSAAIAGLFSPINLIVAAVALLGAAWAENWLGIRTVLTDFWKNTAQPALSQLREWLQVQVPIAIQTLSDYWNTVLLPALQAVWAFIEEHLVPVWKGEYEWLRTNIPLAIQILSDYWNTVLLPALQAVWAFMQEYLIPLQLALADVMNAVVGLAVRVLAGLWKNVLWPALKKVWAFIQDNVIPVLEALAVKTEERAGPQLTWLREKVLEPLHKAFKKIKDIIKKVIDFLEDLADAIRNVQLPDWLEPGSPSPFEESLTGIAKTIKQKTLPAVRELSDAIGGLGTIGGEFAFGAAGAVGYGAASLGQVSTAAVSNEYNFNLNVATRDTATAVIQEFEIMQALVSA